MILLFGPNCTGKSTVGEEVAHALARCAFIEVDELRYKIKGGLVAWSGGTPALEQPAEYRRQCRVAEENAVRLARGFAEAGFSSVIDNLAEDLEPGGGWSSRALAGYRLFRLLFYCESTTLRHRFAKRYGQPPGPELIYGLNRCLQHADSYDLAVDTGIGAPASVAMGIIESLRLAPPTR